MAFQDIYQASHNYLLLPNQIQLWSVLILVDRISPENIPILFSRLRLP